MKKKRKRTSKRNQRVQFECGKLLLHYTNRESIERGEEEWVYRDSSVSKSNRELLYRACDKKWTQKKCQWRGSLCSSWRIVRKLNNCCCSYLDVFHQFRSQYSLKAVLKLNWNLIPRSRSEEEDKRWFGSKVMVDIICHCCEWDFKLLSVCRRASISKSPAPTF